MSLSTAIEPGQCFGCPLPITGMPSGQIWNLESSDAEDGVGGAVAVIPAPFDDFEEESLAIGAAVELEEVELEEFAVRVGRNPQRTRAAWWMFSLLTGRKSGRTSSDRRSSAFDPSGN